MRQIRAMIILFLWAFIKNPQMVVIYILRSSLNYNNKKDGE